MAHPSAKERRQRQTKLENQAQQRPKGKKPKPPKQVGGPGVRR